MGAAFGMPPRIDPPPPPRPPPRPPILSVLGGGSAGKFAFSQSHAVRHVETTDWRLTLGQRAEWIAIRARGQRNVDRLKLKVILLKPLLDPVRILIRVRLDVGDTLALAINLVLGKGNVVQANIHAHVLRHLAQILVRGPPMQVANV